MIARALECLHLDVLVDLSGFTEFNCQAALMRRPVAVQVNWLGFPGTLAGGAHDFIIGDSFVLPTGCERFYAERLVRLPCCYQPNDEHRVASVAPSNLRERLGISSSLVAGVFNTGHKLGAQNLLFWARLLLRTQALQLLILSPGKPFEENFRSLLRSEGVDVDRVVFTDSMAYEEHMMRFQACDFMLDTSPYGAHTTASEALWNGCPVFTVPGQTFASRVAGSLNHHAGLGDLANFDSYDSLLRAVQVLDSGNMTRLIELRGRLGQFNTGLPIFDSAQFFEHFEAALHRMVS
jgi:predicted O-linked N-acetylglucosamine transferase (SPINDLY family)